MRDESCIPVMMRLIGEGRPVIEPERLTAFLILPVILLWAMMGFASPVPAPAFPQEPEPAGPVPGPARRVPCMRGMFPAGAGIAGGCTRAFLITA